MILVTGATGYLGSHLVETLLKSHPHIRALKRTDSIIPTILNPLEDRIEWVNGDVRDIFSLESAFKGVSMVFHCAGIIQNKGLSDKEVLTINLGGTTNLVDLCLELKIHRLIYISSLATFGNYPISHSLLYDFNKSKSIYVFSKIEAEKEVWRARIEGLSTLIINPGLILSKKNDPFPNPHLVKLYQNGSRYFTTLEYGIIWIEDLVNCLSEMANQELKEPQYILSSENSTGKEIVKRLNACLGLQEPRIPYDPPGKSGKGLGFFRSTNKKEGIMELSLLEDGMVPAPNLDQTLLGLRNFTKLIDLF